MVKLSIWSKPFKKTWRSKSMIFQHPSLPKTVKKNSGKKSPVWCGIVGILRKWWIFKKLEIRNETVVLKTVWTTFLFKKQPSLQRGRNGEKTLLDIYHTSWRSPRCLVYWGSKKWVKNGDLWKSVDFLLTKTKTRQTSIKSWIFKLGPVFVTHVLFFPNSFQIGGKIIIYN